MEMNKKKIYSLIKSNHSKRYNGWYLLYEPIDQFLYLFQDLPTNHKQNKCRPYSSMLMDISLGEIINDNIGNFLTDNMKDYSIILKKYDTKNRYEDIFNEIKENIKKIKDNHSKQRKIKDLSIVADLKNEIISLNEKISDLLKKIIEKEKTLKVDLIK